MSILKKPVIHSVLIFFCVLSSLAYANDDNLGCQMVNDAQYSANAPSILAQTETVNTKINVAEASQILLDCNAPSLLSVNYQMDIESDISAAQTLQFYGKTFYKIRKVNGQSAGGEGLNYLIDHAYVAFSINSMNNILPITSSQENQQVNILASKQMQIDADHFNYSPYLVDVELFFDALPTNDEIVTHLNTMPIQLNLGQFNIELYNTVIEKKWTPTVSPQLYLNLRGMQFQRPTCFVKEQTVMMGELSVSAFKQLRPALAGSSQPFSLEITCDGYLNKRKMNLIWKDNNWLENMNSIGYLSSVTGEGYSNVGIQIRDEINQAILIGKSYDLSDPVKGNTTSRRYLAQYLLMDPIALVGKVNAQAIIQIDYR